MMNLKFLRKMLMKLIIMKCDLYNNNDFGEWFRFEKRKIIKGLCK